MNPDIPFQRFLHRAKQSFGAVQDNEEALVVAQPSPDEVIDQPAADAFVLCCRFDEA